MLIGFIADAGTYETKSLPLVSISAMATAGGVIGGMLSKTRGGENLKKGFGLLVRVMGKLL